MVLPDAVAVIPTRRHGKARIKIDGHISALCNRTERRFGFSKPLFLIPRSRSARVRFGATELIPSRPSTRRRQSSDQRNRITSFLAISREGIATIAGSARGVAMRGSQFAFTLNEMKNECREWVMNTRSWALRIRSAIGRETDTQARWSAIRWIACLQTHRAERVLCANNGLLCLSLTTG
jgi:hypothetical protein